MSDVQKFEHRHIPGKGGIPLSPGNSDEEGERANGERPRQRKEDPRKKRQKGSYGVGRTLLSMLGRRTLLRECLLLGMIACGCSGF